MFEDRTQANIKAEALALLSPEAGVSALAGSYADATLGAVAGQLSELYQVLPAVVSMLFVDESSGPYIDLVGKTYFNITRRPGTKARCSITLNGDAGTILPAGTVFLTRSGLEFILMEAVTIPQGGTAEGTLEAAEAGAAYNVGAGEITRRHRHRERRRPARPHPGAPGEARQRGQRMAVPPVGPQRGRSGRRQGGGAL